MYEIKQDGWQKDIYNEICANNGGNIELAESKSQANCVYRFWKVNDPKSKGGKVSMHPEKHTLNFPNIKRNYGSASHLYSRFMDLLKLKLKN